ncbi:MAG: type II toxin-antitoxin system MqsA family antitoxin [Desulfomicrobium sp.]|nr:type II toxin-antitoxin system MqsA family antitoxin [Desulfomicrobium sp.]
MINFKHGDSCPVCEVGALQERAGSFAFTYKDENFSTTDITEYHCELCDETFLNREDERKVERMAIEFRREVDGLLAPSEIKKIREKLSCTQVELAKLLGVAEKTFARYENGTVTQSKSMDIALRLIQDDPDRSLAVICEKKPVIANYESSFEWKVESKIKTFSGPYNLVYQNLCVSYDLAQVG